MFTSSQSILNIQDIKDDLLITKAGTFCLIIQTNAINFDLLSETEQDAMIGAYAQLVNSLSFPIQIVIHTRRMDISNYLLYLENFEKRQPNKTLRDQISYYRKFINQLVVTGNVLYKKFFIILSYQEAETQKMGALSKVVGNTIKKEEKIEITPRLLENAKTNLYEKREFVVGLLSRMGIKAEQLNSRQIVELFYSIYNPSESDQQHLTQQVEDYTAAIVQPVLE
ncbi:hypothetical protein A2X44_03490 [candidate division CPR3 bacterium GWF2_35_18]|uniref:Type IV secretory pathway VirB4 component-like protein n=1 Tax=candidate division CPR3 bacterium GW2011_GWF2_35_18 TaxID=1618350 RepID=A0A0G0E2W3_UNCC3|nr:MAG: hypothetical protein UR67_C0005G0059 [candidate division CPR3 bacterium GW2011_GWF2_35_18]KKP85847.1 MAG: hypothetical protein UR87_C0037G0005 [candidate division CPR3 bacterium GW2011_GWE2_35_7]OGB63043.1 MAG: hypothetical protein A2X44_03490 [candidate division CPR3 bacterium GWF2_35_18]OGB63933.1 MAG: hypothetical protein A2250_02715 [candidate division CPR3 bacterium RIFOXYA2_FULL_35_13]